MELERKTSKSPNARSEIAWQYDQFVIEFGPDPERGMDLAA